MAANKSGGGGRCHSPVSIPGTESGPQVALEGGFRALGGSGFEFFWCRVLEVSLLVNQELRAYNC